MSLQWRSTNYWEINSRRLQSNSTLKEITHQCASNLDDARQSTAGLVKVVNKTRQRNGDEKIPLPQTANLHVFHCAAQHKVSTTTQMSNTFHHCFVYIHTMSLKAANTCWGLTWPVKALTQPCLTGLLCQSYCRIGNDCQYRTFGTRFSIDQMSSLQLTISQHWKGISSKHWC